MLVAVLPFLSLLSSFVLSFFLLFLFCPLVFILFIVITVILRLLELVLLQLLRLHASIVSIVTTLELPIFADPGFAFAQPTWILGDSGETQSSIGRKALFWLSSSLSLWPCQRQPQLIPCGASQATPSATLSGPPFPTNT